MKLNQIIAIHALANSIFEAEIYVGEWAQNVQAGQFLMVRVHAQGERFPLTIVATTHTSVTLVFRVIGQSTRILSESVQGDVLYEVLGPLGKPTIVDLNKKTCIIGGGVGNAISFAILKHFNHHNQDVIYVGGFKKLNEVFYASAIETMVTSSYFYVEEGNDQYLVGNVLKDLKTIIESHNIAQVYCAGPLLMMAAVTEYCKDLNVDVIVSLNPIMVDGIGMCGGCRVELTDGVAFACLDGPEFFGHDVNFESLRQRNLMYDEDDYVKV